MTNRKLFDIIGELNEEFIVDAAPKTLKLEKTSRPVFRAKWILLVAAFILLLSVAFSAYVVAAEVQEYNAAVRFFDEHDLSSEGLSRREIKAVYRDITTRSFAYEKTAEVIINSFGGSIDGFEISQDDPTPEEIEKLWEYKNRTHPYIPPKDKVVENGYKCYHIYDYSKKTDKSMCEKYVDGALKWTVEFNEMMIDGYISCDDSVLVYGSTTAFSSLGDYEWIAMIGADGELLWTKPIDHGDEIEHIVAVFFENEIIKVFSKGENEYLYASSYDVN